MVAESSSYGLTRHELEYHLRWIMRKIPKDPAKVPEFMGEVIVTLIEENNEAIAKCMAEVDRPDLPESF